jgi:hypothetical protein
VGFIVSCDTRQFQPAVSVHTNSLPGRTLLLIAAPQLNILPQGEKKPDKPDSYQE